MAVTLTRDDLINAWLVDPNATQSNVVSSSSWNSDKLREWLEWEEKYTALSSWQIKSWAKKAGNWIKDKRHSLTDKDTDKGILDYSDYKQYKPYIDSASDEDREQLMRQMADQWVINYDRFSEMYEPDEEDTNKYKEAVASIKNDFKEKISNSLSPYMSQTTDSYQINALTKAIEKMCTQYDMFVDAYTDTYKNTRDDNLLKDFDDTLEQYENDIVTFTEKRAEKLVAGKKGMGAYYDTLNDEWMKELANDISEIQAKAENRMAWAAIKSNLWDAWHELTHWHFISMEAELIWAWMNAVNRVLDKLGNVVEEGKQWLLWRYDVVEELNHLNVYSNDAWALEKAFGTVWYWVSWILDAAPTIVPAVADLIFWSKTWLISKTGKVGKLATKIDDLVPVLFRSNKQLRAARWVEWAIELGKWTKRAQYIQEWINNILIYDIAFQQFEGKPLTDDNIAANLVANIIADGIAVSLSEWLKVFSPLLKKWDLLNDTISREMFDMLQKAHGAGKDIKLAAEEFYMWKTIEYWTNLKRTVNIETLKWVNDDLYNYIKEVQKDSNNVMQRLSTFGASGNDILLEMQSNLAKRKYKDMPIHQRIEYWIKELEIKQWLVDAFTNQVRTKSTLNYITRLINEWSINADQVNKALSKVNAPETYKKIITSIFTWDEKLYADTLVELKEAWTVLSPSEMNSYMSQLASNIIKDNPSVVKVWDIVNGYMKDDNNTFIDIFAKADKNGNMPTLTEKELRTKFNNWIVEDVITSRNKVIEDLDDAINKVPNPQWDTKIDVTNTFINNQKDFWLNNFNPQTWNTDAVNVPSAILTNKIFTDNWLSIKSVDGKFVIEGSYDNVMRIRWAMESLSAFAGISEMTDDTINTFKLLYAPSYGRYFSDNISIIEHDLWRKLTQEEKVSLANNYKTWTDKLYFESDAVKQAKEIEKKHNDKVQVNKRVTKNNKKVKSPKITKQWEAKVNQWYKEVLDWESNINKLEWTAAAAVVESDIKNQTLTREELLDKLVKHFEIKLKWQHRAIIGDGRIIAEKIADNLAPFYWEEWFEWVADLLTNWFGTMVSIPAVRWVLLDNAWDDAFYKTVLSKCILDNKDVCNTYLTVMSENMKTAYNKIIDSKMNIVAKEEWIRQLNKWYKKLTDWINLLKSRDAEILDRSISKIDWTLLLNKVQNLLDTKDLEEWAKQISKLENATKIMLWAWDKKVYELKNMSDKEITDVADIIATIQMKDLWFTSNKFYNKLKSQYERWLHTMKDTLEVWDKWTFTISYTRKNWYRYSDDNVVFWLFTESTLLGNLDNDILWDNVVLHEFLHREINNKKLLKAGNTDYLDKAVSELKRSMLDTKEFGWSALNRVLVLKDYLKKTAETLNVDEKKVYNNFMYRYNNSLDLGKLSDSVNEYYNKDTLINTLIERYSNVDDRNIVWLWDFISKSESPELYDIEEMVVELLTLQRLQWAWFKHVNNIEINNALDTLEKAANIMDRFRILCIEKKEYTPNELRKILSSEYDKYDIMKVMQAPEIVARLLSWNMPAGVSREQYVKTLQSAMWVKNLKISSKTTPNSIKSQIVSNLNNYKNELIRLNKSYDNVDKLSKQIEGMTDSEVVSLVDMMDWINFTPKQYVQYKKETDLKLWEDWYVLDINHNLWDDVFSVWLDVLNKSSKSHKKKDIEYVNQVKQFNKELNNKAKFSNKTVPVVNTLQILSNLYWDAWQWYFKILNWLTSFKRWIDADKLLIWKNTINAYNGLWKDMDFAMFNINRIFANILSVNGAYNQEVIDAINKANQNVVLSTVLNTYSHSNNTRVLNDIVDYILNSAEMRMWDSVVNMSSKELLTKVIPSQVSWFNDLLTRYLKALNQWQSWEDELTSIAWYVRNLLEEATETAWITWRWYLKPTKGTNWLRIKKDAAPVKDLISEYKDIDWKNFVVDPQYNISTLLQMIKSLWDWKVYSYTNVLKRKLLDEWFAKGTVTNDDIYWFIMLRLGKKNISKFTEDFKDLMSVIKLSNDESRIDEAYSAFTKKWNDKILSTAKNNWLNVNRKKIEWDNLNILKDLKDAADDYALEECWVQTADNFWKYEPVFDIWDKETEERVEWEVKPINIFELMNSMVQEYFEDWVFDTNILDMYRLKYDNNFLIKDIRDDNISPLFEQNTIVRWQQLSQKKKQELIWKLPKGYFKWVKARLVNQLNWFVVWNKVDMMNTYWVWSVLWKVLDGKKINSVSIQLSNWQNVSYILSDWEPLMLMKNRDTIYDVLWDLVEWNNIYINYVWEWGEILDNWVIHKWELWQSFFWKDIAKMLWVEDKLNIDIDKASANVIYQQYWKRWWSNNTTNIEEFVNFIDNLWVKDIWVNDNAALNIVYNKLVYEKKVLEYQRAALKKAKAWESKLQDINENINRLWEVTSAIQAKLKNTEYKVEEFETMLDKVNTLKINDVPIAYDTKWNIYVKGKSSWKPQVRITIKRKNWEIVEQKYLDLWKDKKKRISWTIIVDDDYVPTQSNIKEHTISTRRDENVWSAKFRRPKYDIVKQGQEFIDNRTWESVFEEEIIDSIYSDELQLLKDWTTYIWDDIINNKYQDRIVGWEFAQTRLNMEDWELLVTFVNDTTWEEMTALVRRIDAIDSRTWKPFPAYEMYFNDWLEWIQWYEVDELDANDNRFGKKIALMYNKIDWWKDANDVFTYKPELDIHWLLQYTDDWKVQQVAMQNAIFWAKWYKEARDAAIKTRMEQFKEFKNLTPDEIKHKDFIRKQQLWEAALDTVDKDIDKAVAEWATEGKVQELIDEAAVIKEENNRVNKIENYNIVKWVDSESKAMNRLLAFTNYDILSKLKQIRWEQARFVTLHKERLWELVNKRDELTKDIDEDGMQEIYTAIKWQVNKYERAWITSIKSLPVPWIWKELSEVIEWLADITFDMRWKNNTILRMINSKDSFDKLYSQATSSYYIAALWATGLSSRKEVTEYLTKIVWQYESNPKHVSNIVKDFIWDPLGTWLKWRAIANIRDAYRFCKYSVLSPVSWTMMYLNSAALWETLLLWKKRNLYWYLDNEAFNKIVNNEKLLWILNRKDEILINGNTDMFNKWLFVNDLLTKTTNALTKPWTKANELLWVVMKWWYHSLRDVQKAWEVKLYAFAEALKHNHIYESQLPDLLKKVESWKIWNPEYREIWNKILADTDEYYSRYFTNWATTSLSRHKRSRSLCFNFLQWYVINRADEMMLWLRKWREFIKTTKFKNMTWNDVTRHLAEDNPELKSFLNNILASAKLWYYLDRAADSDWTDADNMRWYFIDTNDYLSSLDTTFFMRLLKAPFEWMASYIKYSNVTNKPMTITWWIESAVLESFADVSQQFFREGKFLSAMLNTIVAWMQTWDLNFAATVLGTEREKMSNSLWRFGLVDWMEKYWLEDFSEESDIIWQILLSTDKTTRFWQMQDDIYDITRIDNFMNNSMWDNAVTVLWYMPAVWELIKYLAGKWWYNFTEAKYKEMMHMVEDDAWLRYIYNGHINTDVFSPEAIKRIYSDFTAFNYPYETMKTVGKHAVWSYINWEDTTLNSMKEDVFVQNMCEHLNLTIEQFHDLITSHWTNTADKTWRLKIMAAWEAAQPGSWKIILSYMMANRLYELEKAVSWLAYPKTADIPEDVMVELKRQVIQEFAEEEYVADRASQYKVVREYISEVNPEVFKTLYKNETLNGYVSSIWFMDMLMHQAAQDWDINAKYIKNAFSVLTKYMPDEWARLKTVEYICGLIDSMEIPSDMKDIAMEWVLAWNIDVYNELKNSPILSTLHQDVLDSFEHRIWGIMDRVDMNDNTYTRSWSRYSKYPKYRSWYTSNYATPNQQVDNDFKNAVSNLPNPLKTWTPYVSRNTPIRYRWTNNIAGKPLDFYIKVYETHIKALSDKLVGPGPDERKGNNNGRKPYEWTYKTETALRNRWYINPARLTFPRHKQPAYSTKVLANMPGASG